MQSSSNTRFSEICIMRSWQDGLELQCRNKAAAKSHTLLFHIICLVVMFVLDQSGAAVLARAPLKHKLIEIIYLIMLKK